MIEEAHLAGTPPRAGKKPAPSVGEGFSLAMAEAALEARAGASLKSFGHAAQSDAIVRPGRAGRENSPARTPMQRASADAGPESGGEARLKDTAPATKSSETAAPAVVETARPQASLVPASAVPSAISSAAPIAAKQDVAALRALTETAAPKAALAPQRPAPVAAPRSFAEILARRLEGGENEFELRLDPPDLGKVHARLSLGDDGKAALALRFDSAAAMDLLLRDADALRTALASAGFDLARENLHFTHEPARRAAASSIDAIAIETPVAEAPQKRGLIDLRI